MTHPQPQTTTATESRESERKSPEEIRGEIKRTRQRMDSTLDGFESKLGWTRWRRDIEDGVRDAGRSVINSTGRIARKHPIPAGLVGAGVVWLLVESLSSRTSSSSVDNRSSAPVGKTGSSHTDRVRQQLHSSAVRVQSAKLARRRESEKDGGESFGERARQQMATSRATLNEGAQQVRLGFWRALDNNPLAAGAATFVVGVAIGSALPSTGWEDELVGEASDTVIDRVKEQGREAAEAVQERLEVVAGAAIEEVKEQTSELQN